MDKIVEGILQSDKPDGLKKQMCRRVEDLGRTTHPSSTVLDIFTMTTRLILTSTHPQTIESCKGIFLVWAKNNRASLESYLTVAKLNSLLDEAMPNQHEAMWITHQTMLLIRSDKPEFIQLCSILEMKGISHVRHYPDFDTVSAFCRFLFDFRECIPKEHRSSFCTSLISAAGTFSAPTNAAQMKTYIRDVTNIVGGLLAFLWKDPDQTVIGKSLEQLFSIISHVDHDLTPSLALAGIVPHIPVAYVNSIVKQTVSDSNIPDDNMKEALGRMINWLHWPGAKNLDTWIIAFFRGLASVHKCTILMDVTESHIVEVYKKLEFPIVRESAFEVLSHMLLSFQLFPEPFHKIVQRVPTTVSNLLAEQSDTATRLACRLARLLHILMSHHLGFPDLYEPILDAVKNLPRPSAEEIRQELEVSSWTSSQKKVNISTYTSWSRKSETGKTGLVNLGNTCYMNSVLQALFMSDSFRRDVFAMQPSKHMRLMLKLQYVFGFLSISQRAAYAPGAFHNAFRPPWFTSGYQQDCSEFLRHLYDQLHEEELAAQRAIHQQECQDKMDTDSNPPPAASLIQKTFSGKMVNTFRCLTCQKETSHSEMFTDIPLAFPESVNNKALSGRSTRSVNQKSAALVGGASGGKAPNPKAGTTSGVGQEEEGREKAIELEELLHHYLRPERLQGDNKYHCEVCKGLRDAERSMQIACAPEYLNLTLLRFAYNVKAKSRSKIFTEVSYPKTLRLPVLSANSRTLGAYRGTRGKVKKSKSDIIASHGNFETYALSAVIVHSGYSSDSGHYYCYARHSLPVTLESPTKMSQNAAGSNDLDYLQDRWYLMNDSRVSYSSYESFSNVTKNFSKDTAYVLFYKRISPDSDVPMETVDVNQSIMTALVDPPLRSDIRAAIDKDNKVFVQEQEMQERTRAVQASSKLNATQYYDWKDHDDNGPPGSCGGGGGGGLSTNRLVF